jgi:hypothetical protein
MLRSVWTELDYRIDICRVTKGSHIEHLQLRRIHLKTCATNHVCILAKSLIISFQYNIESVYFFYSKTVFLSFLSIRTPFSVGAAILNNVITNLPTRLSQWGVGLFFVPSVRYSQI